jgi:hypothetical protein
MVLTFGYIFLNVSETFNLYPIYVLAWVLSEMLAVPHIERTKKIIDDNKKENLNYQ